jgi:hypothetical protein
MAVERQSPKLLAASATSAVDPAKDPITKLRIVRIIFPIMAFLLAEFPAFSRFINSFSLRILNKK